jgi:hypothetical protein
MLRYSEWVSHHCLSPSELFILVMSRTSYICWDDDDDVCFVLDKHCSHDVKQQPVNLNELLGEADITHLRSQKLRPLSLKVT